MSDVFTDDDLEFAEDEEGENENGETLSFVAQTTGERLDIFLAARIPALSRSQVQRIVSENGASVNGVVPKPSLKLVAGDTVTLTIPPVRDATAKPEAIPLNIVYEDADLLVVNKQKGLVVHPAPGALSGTLVNALLHHCTDLSGIGGEERPGIVHRLDKDTTGLMMVAKNDAAHRALQTQIQTKTAVRRYLASVWGRPAFNDAVIDAPLGRHLTDRKKMAVMEPGGVHAGRSAQTHVSVVKPHTAISLVECVLQTGRTHQIRVHMAYIGHGVVGDATYGGDKRVSSEGIADAKVRGAVNEHIAGMTGQALHSYKLAFAHPRTGEALAFTAPLPQEMAILQQLLNNVQ